MLTAKADFPTPGDPLVQIILWLLVLLTSVSIACKMSLWVPSIYNLHSLSFFPPSTLTFSATVFSFYNLKFPIYKCWLWITDDLSWIFEIADMYGLNIICYGGWYYELDNLDNEYRHRDQTLLYEDLSQIYLQKHLSYPVIQFPCPFEWQWGCTWLGWQIQ